MKFYKPILNLKLASFAEKGNFNKKIVGFISSDLCWVLIVAGIFRLFYYSLFFDTIAADSPSYLNYNFNIFKGQIDAVRTPIYPYFIEFVRLLGRKNLVQNIVIAQAIVSFLTITVFYKIAYLVFKMRSTIITATLFYALMLPIINFDKVILTESLTICCIIIFIRLIVGYLKKPTFALATILTTYTFLAIMLRPAFVFLLPIVTIFWIFRFLFFKKDKIICLMGLAALLLVLLLLHGYSSLNKTKNGFYGISTVSNINQLDIVIGSNMYMDGNDAELSDVIKNNFSKPMTSDEHWNPLMQIIHHYKPKRISDFINNCIKNNPRIFIERIFSTFFSLQNSNFFTNYAHPKNSLLAKSVINVQSIFFYITFNKVFIILILDFIFILRRWIKSKQAPWFNILLWLIVVGQIAVAIIGAQSDYQRLVLAAIPCLIIIIFLYIDRIYHAIDSQKFKNYLAFGSK